MKAAAAAILLLLASGCAATPRLDRPDALLAETQVIEDERDASIEPVYDLRRLDVRELNGSLLFTLEFENLSGRLPEFMLTAEITTRSGTREFFVRNEAAYDRPAPHLRWRWGAIENDEEVAKGEICAISSTTQPPWTIQAELLNNHSGLLDAGRLEQVRVETGDFQGTAKDSAEASPRLALRGGANPHAGCPLLAERPRPAA